MLRWPWLLLPLLFTCAHRPWEDPGPRWQRITSAHFAIDTDSDPAACAPLIDRLEDVHAALSRTFFQGLEVPRVQVLLFDRARDFQTMAPSKLITGFFHSFPDEGGVLVFSSQASSFEVVASIAAHELAHRFTRALAPDVPAWLNEGFARYVETIELKDDLVVFDASAALGHAYHAPLVPLARLFAATNRNYHHDTDGGYYLTSWRIVRELFGNPGPQVMERFRTLVQRAAAASTPAEQAAAVSAALGRPIAEIEASIRSAHQRAQWGVGQTESRRTLAVTLQRPPRKPPEIAAVEPGEIRTLCRAVMGLEPPPTERCFVGFQDQSGRPDAGARGTEAAPPARSPYPEQVARLALSHSKALKACYERELARQPDLAGRVEVEFTIARDGTVARSAIASSTLRSVAVESCVGKAICGWVFPRPEHDEPVTVTYPLSLRPASRP